jgi:electron transport complex protein RnfD
MLLNNKLNTSQIMFQVICALSLGIAANYYYFGWGIIFQIILAIITSIIVESIFLSIRKLPIKSTITDFSGILTAILLAVSIPSIAPWWIIVLGTSFAIIFGKHIYGGLGHNPFNPAMLGYAFLLISYPLQMTTWANVFLDIGQSFDLIFNAKSFNAISGATLLDDIKTKLSLGKFVNEIYTTSDSQIWINIGFLLGGIYLLIRKIIYFHIPLAFLLGLSLTSLILSLIDSDLYMPFYFHLTTGATMLGAFFIATDPVSSSTTPIGRLIYGFCIGVLVIIIRVFGGYPDGIAFAVLLMNITVPLIDYYTKPKIFGDKN